MDAHHSCLDILALSFLFGDVNRILYIYHPEIDISSQMARVV